MDDRTRSSNSKSRSSISRGIASSSAARRSRKSGSRFSEEEAPPGRPAPSAGSPLRRTGRRISGRGRPRAPPGEEESLARKAAWSSSTSGFSSRSTRSRSIASHVFAAKYLFSRRFSRFHVRRSGRSDPRTSRSAAMISKIRRSRFLPFSSRERSDASSSRNSRSEYPSAMERAISRAASGTGPSGPAPGGATPSTSRPRRSFLLFSGRALRARPSRRNMRRRTSGERNPGGHRRRKEATIRPWRPPRRVS